METAVILKRQLFGRFVSQNSLTGFFSGTDLVKAGNAWRVTNGMEVFDFKAWKATKGVKEFIEHLEKELGPVISISRGRGHHTWVHPFVFIDMALAISPSLKIEVYSWIFDQLVKFRNTSGDSYKKMSGALYINQKNKSAFPHDIKEVALKIKKACHVEDWQHANEEQLELRNKIHENISLLCDVLRDNDQAVKVAILKAIKEP